MQAATQRSIWINGYCALALLPLATAVLARVPAPSAGFALELAIATGFVAFALLALELALVARLQPASRLFGSDALMLFHRAMGFVALAFVVAHAALAAASAWSLALLDPFAGSTAVRSGALAFWCAVLIVASALLRRALRLPWEAWRALHSLLSVVLVAASVVHVLAARATPPPLLLALPIAGYGALFIAVLVHYRIVRPLRLSRRHWEVVANRDEGGATRTLVVRPVGHPGFAFEPGQFAWIATGRAALLGAQHPITISSSAVPPPDRSLELSIKALGNWSGGVVPALRPGARIWLDGPFGSLSPDRLAADRLALIGGGIGVTPMRSILLTLRDRGDRRPIVLFHAARNRERMLFEREFAALRDLLDLRIVQVFEEPEPDAECGLVTTEILQRHLPEPRGALAFFVCGPGPMMEAVDRSLAELGIAPEQIHSERFDLL